MSVLTDWIPSTWVAGASVSPAQSSQSPARSQCQTVCGGTRRKGWLALSSPSFTIYLPDFYIEVEPERRQGSAEKQKEGSCKAAEVGGGDLLAPANVCCGVLPGALGMTRGLGREVGGDVSRAATGKGAHERKKDGGLTVRQR